MSTVPAGWQAIDIDGIGCLIGWIEGEDDAYWAVVRHGCQVAKGLSREAPLPPRESNWPACPGFAPKNRPFEFDFRRSCTRLE